MALRIRDELVGKRFLAVCSGIVLRLSRISEWEWRTGVIRAVSHKDAGHPELTVLLESDDKDWTCREWVKVCDVFQVFLVEKSLVWIPRTSGDKKLWKPALNFKPVTSDLDCGNTKVRPVELVGCKQLVFVDERQNRPYQDIDASDCSDVEEGQLSAEGVKQWIDFQNAQSILLTTPSVLVGYRVQVYRTEGTTQWYTAVIQSYNEKTRELHLLDDTVLEEHYEDPALVQMNLLGDGVVDSILRGEDVGITPRRRACNNRDKSGSKESHHTSLNYSVSVRRSSAGKTTLRQPTTATAGKAESNHTKVKQRSATDIQLAVSSKDQETSKLSRTAGGHKKKSASEHAQDAKPEGNTGKKKPKRSVSPAAVPARSASLINEKVLSPGSKTSQNDKFVKSVTRESRSSRKVKSEKKVSPDHKGKAGKDLVVGVCKTKLDQSTLDAASDRCVVKLEQLRRTPETVTESRRSASSSGSTGTSARKSKSKPKCEKVKELKKVDSSEKGDTDSEEKVKEPKGVGQEDSALICAKDAEAESKKKDTTHTSSDSPNCGPLAHRDVRTKVREDSSFQERVPPTEETSTMHYKKMRILADSLQKEKEKCSTPENTTDSSAGLSASINVNHSVTDQIAKLSSVKGEKLSWNNNDIAASTAYDANKQHEEAGTAKTKQQAGLDEKEKDPGIHYGSAENRESAGSAPPAPIKQEKGCIQDIGPISPQSVNVKTEDSKLPKHSSTNSSPLVFNKDEPVLVYRDPELLKKDAGVRHLHNMTGSMQPGHSTPTPGSTSSKGNTFPKVHTPIPTPHPTSLSTHHQLGPAQSRPLLSQIHNAYTAQQLSSLGVLGPHMGLQSHGLDPHSPLRGGLNALAHHQALQLQYGAFLQQHQQQQLLTQYPLHSTVPTSHLEMLWQQKYPSLPVPPPWMLLQYQEELLRDVNPVRERELAVERERREREQQLAVERERIEREKERERQERERKEREKAERLERERVERERAEKLEKERKEKERLQHEQQKRLERERILKESAEAAAAVNQHFMESFRLATQKAVASGTWMPSITLGLPRHSPNSGNPAVASHTTTHKSPSSTKQESNQHVKPTDKPREHEMSNLHHSPHSTEEATEALRRKLNTMCESGLGHAEGHRLRDVLMKSGHADRKMDVSNASVITASPSKQQEANFSLYGYKPFRHSYISPDQLYQHGLKETGRAGSEKSHPAHPPKGKDVKNALSPPPLRKSSPHHVTKSSVIVENKAKDMRGIPPASYPHPTCISTTLSVSSVIPSSAITTQATAGSPLHVASPHQLSAEALRPIDLASSSSLLCHSAATTAQSVVAINRSIPANTTATTTTVVSPPTTLPAHTIANFTQTLIQQGLIPNPIYSNGALASTVRPTVEVQHKEATENAPVQDLSIHHTQTATSHSSSGQGPNKRRTKEEQGRPKKPKLEPGAHTHHQSPGNPSKSPVTSTNTSGTPSVISQPSNARQQPTISLNSGFMDSFRTFVENAVQTAFYQDNEKSEKDKVSASHKHQDSNPPVTNNKTASPPPKQTSTAAAPAPESSTQPPQTAPVSQAAATSTASSMPVSSSSSIMDTINRVANGYIDTDSDTLSAESPPPNVKACEPSASPNSGGSSSHTKGLKKALLQRYSDEDRDKKSDAGSICSTDGGGSRPFSSVEVSSVKEDNSSTSASDTESQGPDSSGKKQKRRKSGGGSSSKKQKTEDTESGSSKRKAARKNKKLKQSDKSETHDLKTENQPSSTSGKKAKFKPPINLARINVNPSSALANKPLNKVSMGQLKKSGTPFMQEGSCSEVTPKLVKCRECKMTPSQRKKKLPNIFCRFYAFRRLRYSQKGYLSIAGFSEPQDADPEDVELWLPKVPVADPQLDIEMAKYIIANVGDKFCELVEQEKEAMDWASKDKDLKVAWKRAVQGVREMCDVCDTTLFNMHWVCQKCGFVVCIDCYRLRTEKTGGCQDPKCINCETAGHKWLSCSANRQPHEPEKLMPTQIIPSNALWQLGDIIHDVRDQWKIHSNCPCGRSKMPALSACNGVSQQLLSAVSQAFADPNSKDQLTVNGVADDHKCKKTSAGGQGSINGSLDNGLDPLSLLADVASMEGNNIEKLLEAKKNEKRSAGGTSIDSAAAVAQAALEGSNSPLCDMSELTRRNGNGCSTLRDLLTKTARNMKANAEKQSKSSKTIHNTLDDFIQKVVDKNIPVEPQQEAITLKHYIPKNGTSMQGRDSPIPQHTLVETSFLFPEVPHSWLDNGRLLRLHEPRHKGNFKLFQKQWQRGQPVLVSNCDRLLNMDLWHPEQFSKEFGELENDLVNCHSGGILVGHPMKDFWDGFEVVQERLVDEKTRTPLILKLKDWPPTEDFSDLLPTRFQDLLQGLPMPEYTHRNGVFNLASRLPEFFVKPDLGPKMYNAYGSALYPKEGTTNLHLDVSDAVNVMVYVGIPRDDEYDHHEAAVDAIEKAGCDEFTKQRVQEAKERPGALWHIFDAKDADKIRDLLNKVAKETGEEIEPHHDPIHDQSWYLDECLRDRLQKEYGVVGYSIVQCLGDAVFIPAGAPHQVRNLHSCIKVAEDFVSPEHLNHCFKMTQEFRHLTDTHSNHEDKLQVKNIIYHAVKDAVAMLSAHEPL